MKPFFSATKQFFKQIWADAMLCMLLFVPIIMGLVFHFGIPFLEGFICEKTGSSAVLAPFYPVFDFLLCAMTPVMFTTAGALVILDEADSGISRAYITSPVGKNGYLFSRIGVSSILATVYCIAATAIFKLTDISIPDILLLSLCSGAMGVTVALMIPSLARNRVEGMAISKLSGLIMLGLPASLLIPAPFKYVAGVLPSFWMTEFVYGGGAWNIVPSILASALLSAIFMYRFRKRIF